MTSVLDASALLAWLQGETGADQVDAGEPFLVDVGFGDAFLEPLRLQPGVVQFEGEKAFRFEREGADWTFWERRGQDPWAVQYRFTLTPRELGDFTSMSEYHQTSPDSHFTQGALVTLPTLAGRVTLRGERLLTTVHGQRDERRVLPQEQVALLREHFGLIVAPLPDRRPRLD